MSYVSNHGLQRCSASLTQSKYRLLGLIGQGQFGRVYCAIHRTTGKLVALKRLDRDRFPTHQFLRELRFLLTLQHPNIVACEALEHIGEKRYLVMEYCEGGTLRNLMETHAKLHPVLSAKLIADVLLGVEHAHSHGIVHCDIKPENILLSLDPTGWTARISDFGIARFSQDLASEQASITGSPAYMAPERFYGQYSNSTDLYAIGVLLFEMLVGDRPFSGSPTELRSAHLNQPVQIPQAISEPFRLVILTALQKLKARRFHSAAQMLVMVKQAASSLGLEQTAGMWATPAEISSQNLTQAPGLATAKLRSALVVRTERLRHKIQRIAVMDHAPLPDSSGDRQPTPSSLTRVSMLLLSEPAASQTQDGRQSGQLYWRSQGMDLRASGQRSGEDLQIAAISEPILDLVMRPQGCFAVTARSLYFVGKTLHLLQQFDQPHGMALDPQGGWVATISQAVESSTFGVWRLPRSIPVAPLECVARTRSPSEGVVKLVALDSRHIAALSRSHYSLETKVDLFSRRGQCFGSLTLPLACQSEDALQFPFGIVALTSAYRFAAIEAQHPYSVLFIRARPLKLTRIGINLMPRFLAAIPNGVVAVSALGQIAVLDHDGDVLGQGEIDGAPSAIVAVGKTGLQIATWDQGQGKLYTLDLTCFGA
ncbi:serine/threonine-protein kinase [Myxacorys almedinensis]|uniref:serine/threonine-protein kinase n=1 Tax=Myxacorys almedinensis TaxID=2651157 RepID=UPI003082D0E6